MHCHSEWADVDACIATLKSFEGLANFCRFGIRSAGILPIAKVLKKTRFIIRFMLQAQQNDERSAERAGIKD
jgi:hypothetical protein